MMVDGCSVIKMQLVFNNHNYEGMRFIKIKKMGNQVIKNINIIIVDG